MSIMAQEMFKEDDELSFYEKATSKMMNASNQRWHCIECKQTSATPLLYDFMLKPGGVVYEEIVKQNVLHDRNVYRYEPLGSFMFDKKLNYMKPLHLTVRKCPKCGQQKSKLTPVQFKVGYSSSEPAVEEKNVVEEKCPQMNAKMKLDLLHMLYMKHIGTFDFWCHLETLPKLFQRKGILFELILEEGGLENDRHYLLPAILPNKTLVYSEADDRLEVCIPNIGHFEICSTLSEDLSRQIKKLNRNEMATLGAIYQPTERNDFFVNEVEIATFPGGNCSASMV